MYLRIVTKKQRGKAYKSMHLVESYRAKTPEGYKIRQRSLANFGNIEHITEKDLDNIFSGLCRIFGRTLETNQGPYADEALEYGAVHALMHLWKELKWDRILNQEAKKTKVTFDLEAHIRTLVFNRLLDPCSKLALLEWLEHVFIPGVDHNEMLYEHLLRAMDFLITNKEDLEKTFAQNLLGLFNASLKLVFYDITSVCFEVRQRDGFREFGYSRDHRPDLTQVVVGLVMTKEGLPVAHYTFPGNTSDRSTLSSTVKDIQERFGIERCCVVADRGMLSEVNLNELQEREMGFLLSLNMKQNASFQKRLRQIKPPLETQWNAEDRKRPPEDRDKGFDVYFDGALEGKRLVVAYNKKRAQESKALREQLMEEAEEEIQPWIDKLNAQDKGKTVKGRKLSDQGVLLKAHDLLKKKGVSPYYKVFLDDDGFFRCHVDVKKRNRAERLDGILAVITTEKDLDSQEVIKQYKGLQDIERGFRTLKSSLDIRPVYHYSEPRIKAHIFLCVMALQLQRLMRLRLKRADSELSPEKALFKLSGIHALKAGDRLGLTTVKPDQKEVCRQLEIPFPKVNKLTNSDV